MLNFINILCTNFLYRSLFGSFFYLHVTRENLPKRHSYEKFAHKMLMKLTPRIIELSFACIMYTSIFWKGLPLVLMLHKRLAVCPIKRLINTSAFAEKKKFTVSTLFQAVPIFFFCLRNSFFKT